MEANVNALGLAQDIFFGSEKEQLEYSEKQREDRINGMNESAAQAIAHLEIERIKLEELTEREKIWLDMQQDKRNAIEENTIAMFNLNAELEKQVKLMQNLISMEGGGNIARAAPASMSSYQGSSSYDNPTYTDSLGQGISIDPAIVELQDAISDFFAPKTPYGDFISRPGQPASNFSPQDTIIGVKDTSALGGGRGNINITIQGYNKDPTTLAQEVARQIKALA